jgi:hypothetical protein
MRLQPVARGLSDQYTTVFVNAHARRREVGAQRIDNQVAAALLPDRGQAVGGAQVDTDDHRKCSCVLEKEVAGVFHHKLLPARPMQSRGLRAPLFAGSKGDRAVDFLLRRTPLPL